MTRLNHAKVGVVLDMTPQGLHFDIEKKGSELTAQEAEEALGVPELLDTAQYCSKEKLTALGLCDSAKDVVRTHRFNFFTRDKHHYSLLFLGNGDNFKYWRLLPGEGLQTSDVNQTDWAPMAGSATFITVIRTKVTPGQSGKVNRLKYMWPAKAHPLKSSSYKGENGIGPPPNDIEEWLQNAPPKSEYGTIKEFLNQETDRFAGYDARGQRHAR